MDDCRKAIRHLADAVRTFMESLGESIPDDTRLVISATLREAGEAIGDDTIASDYDELEYAPPE